MAGAEPEPGKVGGSGSTLPGRSHGTVRLAPLDPEQLQRVLEQVTRAQPPPSVLSDAGRRLPDGAQQTGPGAEAPRLLTSQELEAICVKVSGDTKIKERAMPPLATIQPKTARQSQLPGGSSSMGVSASSPQLLRVQALGRTESQPRAWRGSPQPPAPQALVQKMLSKRVKAHRTAHGRGITLSPVAASGPHALAAVSSGSARLLISSLHTAHTEKSKKSLRVRTRSGRVSRPPRYKARDYKFIKTEDLAEGHLSDSDDYSELSVEEEEELREKPAFLDLEVCALRPKAFKCQMCEKSYIGKGGLARHCKLNPDHCQLQPEASLCGKANGSPTLGCTDSKTRGLACLKQSTPATHCMEEAGSAWPTLQNGEPVEVEETLVPEPQNRSPSALLRPEKYLKPKSGNWESQAEFSTASLQESRAVQPNSHPAGPSGLNVSRGAELREALRQCGREELLGLVLPQLAQAVTLYELLLVKVEKSPRTKPFFPAVYKEFEQLYDVVKRMCQDYLSSSGACSQEPLEINNDEVARSLGITEFLRKKETPKCSSQETEGKLEEGSGRKRERELGALATGEGLATVKKPRTVALPTDVPEYLPSTNGCQQKPRSSRAPAISKGSEPAATECSLCSEGSCREMVPDSDGNGPPVGQRHPVMAPDDFEARNSSAAPTLVCQDVSGSVLHSVVAEPRGMPAAQESVLSEETAPEHTVDEDSGALRESNSVCDTPSLGGGVELRESGTAEVGDLRETDQTHLSGQQAIPSHALLAEAAAVPLHSILPANTLPAACVSKIVPEPVLHPGPGGSLCTNGDPRVGSDAGDISQLLSSMETHGQRETETAAAIGEPLAFDISDVCQEVLSQGQEQIFIRTSNGFILSYPSTIVSQEEDSVIVTNATGSVLRFGPPEGVTLEAMEAFLTVEAECSQ
ncbi:zinc finger protein 839 isoform X3 [Rattus rattus]|uniref:zinc finger protein 839 isoform X3 n=2 Tax=Rattus rattus TaxID=10117 RepID=UPI0013F2C50F|nr:zinc finger protein 839 isoform X3 [Rattus rattus]